MKNAFIFFLVLATVPALCQDSDSANTFQTGFYVSVMAAGASSSVDDLNQQLRAAGQLPVGESLIGTSVGFTTRFADQNSYGAVRLSTLMGAEEDADTNQKTRLSVWELTSMGHYDLVSNFNWLVYPYLGIGAVYHRLVVSSLTSGGTFQGSLAQLNDDEVVQKRYGSDGLSIFGELGGGVERVLKLSGSDMYIGISGGYRLARPEVWSLEGLKAFDSAFSTTGWIFEFKLRFEQRPNAERPRGLFRFFQ